MSYTANLILLPLKMAVGKAIWESTVCYIKKVATTEKGLFPILTAHTF